jgi:SOS-response transcriptional repressor LexA
MRDIYHAAIDNRFGLTLTQYNIWKFYRSYFRMEKRPPSFAEVKAEFGLASNRHVEDNVKKIVAKGGLRLSPRGETNFYLPVTHDGSCICCGKKDD